MSLDFLNALLNPQTINNVTPGTPAPVALNNPPPAPSGIMQLLNPPAAPQAPTDPGMQSPQQDAIGIQGQDTPYHEGLVRHGFFSAGHTGGNILGWLGDALLVGAGGPALYRDRMQRLRASDALDGMVDDPEGAIKRLSKVDPEAALGMYNQYMTNKRYGEQQARVTRDSDQRYHDTVIDRIRSMIGSAKDPATYAAAVAQARKYAAAHPDVQLPFEISDAYDPNTVAAIQGGGISPEDQRRLNDNDEYRDRRIDQLEEALRIKANHYEVQEQQGDRRLDQGDTRLSQGAERIGIARNNANNKKIKPYTKQSEDGAFTFNPDKNNADYTGKDGSRAQLMKVGGKWQTMKMIKPDGSAYRNVNGKMTLVGKFGPDGKFVPNQ